MAVREMCNAATARQKFLNSFYLTPVERQSPLFPSLLSPPSMRFPVVLDPFAPAHERGAGVFAAHSHPRQVTFPTGSAQQNLRACDSDPTPLNRISTTHTCYFFLA